MKIRNAIWQIALHLRRVGKVRFEVAYTYEELLQAFPPRPIKTESQFWATQQVIDKTESIVSAVLNGQRQLTVEHISKLAEFFRLSPALFIEPAKS
jgi:antitoxin component HigA of HigAB toxin-antitoxin module